MGELGDRTAWGSASPRSPARDQLVNLGVRTGEDALARESEAGRSQDSL